MLLSEAIRLGSLLRPQAFGKILTDGDSCALGAALEAVGLPVTEETPTSAAFEFWPWLDAEFTWCPCGSDGCEKHDTAGEIIVFLNDSHEWSREQIANWVHSLEALRRVAHSNV